MPATAQLQNPISHLWAAPEEKKGMGAWVPRCATSSLDTNFDQQSLCCTLNLENIYVKKDREIAVNIQS